jgi:glycosyltransferase involved in cell wall biosynthesis
VEVYWEILSQADINIAPLKGGVFDDGKSEIKWLEAACLDVPSVVSVTRTYSEILVDGEDVFMAADDEEWFEKLETLITNPALRAQMSGRAAEKAKGFYKPRTLAKNLVSIVRDAIRQEAFRGTVQPVAPDTLSLLLVNVLYPPQGYGGATGVMHNIIQELKRYPRYVLHVFTYDMEKSSSYGLTEDVVDGVHVTRVGIPPSPHFDRQYKNDQLRGIFAKYLDFLRPDLIHFHCIQRLTGAVVQAALDKKIPYVITLHDAWWISDHQFLVDQHGGVCSPVQNDPLLLLRSDLDFATSVRRRRVLADYLHRAEALLAVYEYQANLYRRNGFPQVRVDRNGVTPLAGPVPETAPGGRLRIGYAGGVCVHKGFFLLKKAVTEAALSHSEILSIDFTLGAATEKKEFWGSTPVIFLPKILPERMNADFFANIDVLVAPSISPESFGLITREAAMAGVWVVASRRGALAEDIIEGVNGITFDPEEPEELTTLLQSLDSRPHQYKKRLRGMENLRTVAEQTDYLDGLYQGVLGRKKSSDSRYSLPGSMEDKHSRRTNPSEVATLTFDKVL